MKIPFPLPTHNIFLIFPDRTPLILMPQQWTVGIDRVSLTWAWSMTQLRRATSAQAVSRLATASASPTSIKGRDTSKIASIGLGWAPRQDRLKHCYKTESQVRILQKTTKNLAEQVLQDRILQARILQNEFCRTTTKKFCWTSSARQNSARQIL